MIQGDLAVRMTAEAMDVGFTAGVQAEVTDVDLPREYKRCLTV